jgi:hypothetical protein
MQNGIPENTKGKLTSHQNNVSIGPASEELWCSVVKITLLNRVWRGSIENSHHFRTPSLVQRLDVFDKVLLWVFLAFSLSSTPATGRLFGAWWEGKEGIPLNTTVANVRSDEITLRANIHLISSLVIIGCFQNSLSGKHSVSGIGASLSLLLIRTRALYSTLIVHLRSNGGPNSVGSDKNIRIHSGAIFQSDGNSITFSHILITRHRVSIYEKVGVDCPALINQNFLQVGSVDNSSVRKAEKIGTFLERELDKPVGRSLGVPKVIQRIVSHSERTIGTKT